jgi:outer membrane biosynthesis protein TonB
MSVGMVAAVLAACPQGKQGRGPHTGGSGGGVDDDEAATALTPQQMEEVQQTVRAGQPALTRCYTEELMERGDRKFQGEVVVNIVVGTQSAADRVEIVRSTLNAPPVHDCIKRVVAGWEFPVLPAPKMFSFPFQFEPAY